MAAFGGKKARSPAPANTRTELNGKLLAAILGRGESCSSSSWSPEGDTETRRNAPPRTPEGRARARARERERGRFPPLTRKPRRNLSPNAPPNRHSSFWFRHFHPFTHSPTHPLTHSPTHPFTHSPTPPLHHSTTPPLHHSTTPPLPSRSARSARSVRHVRHVRPVRSAPHF